MQLFFLHSRAASQSHASAKMTALCRPRTGHNAVIAHPLNTYKLLVLTAASGAIFFVDIFLLFVSIAVSHPHPDELDLAARPSENL